MTTDSEFKKIFETNGIEGMDIKGVEAVFNQLQSLLKKDGYSGKVCSKPYMATSFEETLSEKNLTFGELTIPFVNFCQKIYQRIISLAGQTSSREEFDIIQQLLGSFMTDHNPENLSEAVREKQFSTTTETEITLWNPEWRRNAFGEFCFLYIYQKDEEREKLQQVWYEIIRKKQNTEQTLEFTTGGESSSDVNRRVDNFFSYEGEGENDDDALSESELTVIGYGEEEGLGEDEDETETREFTSEEWATEQALLEELKSILQTISESVVANPIISANLMWMSSSKDRYWKIEREGETYPVSKFIKNKFQIPSIKKEAKKVFSEVVKDAIAKKREAIKKINEESKRKVQWLKQEITRIKGEMINNESSETISKVNDNKYWKVEWERKVYSVPDFIRLEIKNPTDEQIAQRFFDQTVRDTVAEISSSITNPKCSGEGSWSKSEKAGAIVIGVLVVGMGGIVLGKWLQNYRRPKKSIRKI